MPGYRQGEVTFNGQVYPVTWHPDSKEVYVYWEADQFAGRAYGMDEALDLALAWLNANAV